MAVKVQNPNVPAILAPGGKPISRKSAHQSSQSNQIFETLLRRMNIGNGESKNQKTAASGPQHGPPGSVISNQDRHPAAGANGTQPGRMQNTNSMAASVLISLAALASGPNRLSGLYSMGSGITGHAGAIMNPSGSTSAAAGRSEKIGGLSSRFESGQKGPEAIGFDPKGGTSYGTFQISSRAGTMSRFIDYLSETAPAWAGRLKAAGSANTGGRHGGMPGVWKRIAAEDPGRFSKLQYDFIERTHYLPALQEIEEKTGVDLGQSPKALQEVLWSTAVQHGPKGAAKIFSRAVDRLRQKTGDIAAARLIGSVYAMRAGQFGSSSADVRAAVRNRLKHEGKLALAMLSEPFPPNRASV